MTKAENRETRTAKMPASTPYEPWLHQRLAKDPEAARLYLQAAMEEALKNDDVGIFQLALKDVAEACGGVTRLARETGLNRQHLYRIMSRAGNPSFTGLLLMLRTFGLGLNVISLTKLPHSQNTSTSHKGLREGDVSRKSEHRGTAPTVTLR